MIDAPSDASGERAGSRPCSQCQQYMVGPDQAWLCYRCGFDGPLPIDAVASYVPTLKE